MVPWALYFQASHQPATGCPDRGVAYQGRVTVSMDAVRLSWQLEDRGLIVDLDDDNRLVVLGGMLDVVRNTRVVETRCHPHLR